MFLFIISLLVLSSKSLANNQINETSCPGIVFGANYYERELLFTGFNKPINLLMHDYKGLTIYFSHTINEKYNNTEIIKCSIKMKECQPLDMGGRAIGYDTANNEIYLGGNGIYKYNFRINTLTYFGRKYREIYDIFITQPYFVNNEIVSNFFYIEYPALDANILIDKNFVPINPKGAQAETILIRKNQFFLSNSTGLFGQSEQNGETKLLLDKLYVKKLLLDTKNFVNFLTDDGIYELYLENEVYHKKSNINSVCGLAFYEDSGKEMIVYSDDKSIYALVESKAKNAKQCVKNFYEEYPTTKLGSLEYPNRHSPFVVESREAK